MVYPKYPQVRSLWFEKLMAIIATLNLGLVLFNTSYVSWRDFYERNIPQLAKLYDPIKGIEPHRETEDYLATVNALTEQISQTGLQSSLVAAKLLELDRKSDEMVDTNPFAAANKSGTLEKIKNRMRSHVGKKSAKVSFETFWSQAYLSQNGWDKQIKFFNEKIRPLIAVNYYRHIGENGEFIDFFWVIDLPFVTLIAVELLARSFYIKRSHPGFSWLDAVLWRWYDLLFLIPFWRWLRVIPVIIRLDRAQLFTLQTIRRQIHRSVVANFAEELTEIIIVRIINQVQGSIKKADLTGLLLQKDQRTPYIDINNVNEIEAIANILVQTVVYGVFPKIQPEIVAILRHNIENVLKDSPLIRNLQILPMVEAAQSQLTEQIATQITTNLYNALVAATEDSSGAKLSSNLIQSFSTALGTELQKKQLMKEIQNLLSDFLEEVKINYIKRSPDEDMNQILEQTRQLHSKAAAQALVKKNSSAI